MRIVYFCTIWLSSIIKKYRLVIKKNNLQFGQTNSSIEVGPGKIRQKQADSLAEVYCIFIV